MTTSSEQNETKKSLMQNISEKKRFWFLASIFVYLFVFTVSYFLAFYIRFDNLGDYLYMFRETVFVVLGVKFFVFLLGGHFTNRNFFASIKELRMIVQSSFISFLILSFLNSVDDFIRLTYVFRSVYILDFGFTICFLGGLFLLWRFWVEDVVDRRNTNLQKAFLVGANQRGAAIANLMNSKRNCGYEIVGFITIHQYKTRMQIGYIPIVGHIDQLVAVARKKNVANILVIAGVLPGSKFRELYDQCRKNDLTLQVVPQREIQTSEKIPIRKIEINDLLKRDPIRLDLTSIRRLVEPSRILVSGAGGSIGSEICRQLAAFSPRELFVLGHGENRIFFLERELKALNPNVKITPVIADVTNPGRIEEVFDQLRPDVVFHAAANKHVPLMEANIKEAIVNNIYGTKVVADAADRFGVAKFIMISTDKAVNPTSVMGTSKHMAERYVNAIATKSKTKFIVTRFGNVLGSNGSVVPIFQEQIQNGGPITLTDKRMTRFFMTIPEASQLVLEAAAMGNGGEIFVLDMGRPVKILELAEDMIRLAGLPLDSIEIQEVGLRPGEKLFEELYFDSEKSLKTAHPKLFASQHREHELSEVQYQIDSLLALLDGDQERIREKLQEFVPEYHPYKVPT